MGEICDQYEVWRDLTEQRLREENRQSELVAQLPELPAFSPVRAELLIEVEASEQRLFELSRQIRLVLDQQILFERQGQASIQAGGRVE